MIISYLQLSLPTRLYPWAIAWYKDYATYAPFDDITVMHCQFNFHAVKKKRINKNTKHVKQIQKLGFSIKFLFVVCIEGTKRASYGDINGCNYGMAAPLFRERQFHPRALFFPSFQCQAYKGQLQKRNIFV